MFTDEVELTVKSGNGGSGAVSFRREKYVPYGGPDGGDGGNGGDVVFNVKKEFRTLNHLKSKKVLKAKNGSPGSNRNKEGAKAQDLIIYVPEGTVIKNYDDDSVIADLSGNNNDVMLLRGGIGGKGNDFFKSSTNQTPRYAQPGRQGKELHVKLELKLIADVGLVGFPNAGKSTLLSCISRANPKIASYPFTTLYPNLGVVNIDQFQQYIVADIPGIIEGASKGVGLGIRFLRHIERTQVILFLIDVTDEDVYNQFVVLNNELKEYDIDLLDKPYLVALNKIDLLEESETKDKLEHFIEALDNENILVYPISAATTKGITALKKKMWKIIQLQE